MLNNSFTVFSDWITFAHWGEIPSIHYWGIGYFISTVLCLIFFRWAIDNLFQKKTDLSSFFVAFLLFILIFGAFMVPPVYQNDIEGYWSVFITKHTHIGSAIVCIPVTCYLVFCTVFSYETLKLVVDTWKKDRSRAVLLLVFYLVFTYMYLYNVSLMINLVAYEFHLDNFVQINIYSKGSR